MWRCKLNEVWGFWLLFHGDSTVSGTPSSSAVLTTTKTQKHQTDQKKTKRHALLRLNICARVCRIITVVKSEKQNWKSQRTGAPMWGSLTELKYCTDCKTVTISQTTAKPTISALWSCDMKVWRCNSLQDIHTRNLLILPVHYLVEFLLIFLIFEMRFKCLLLHCKFLQSILETKEKA